MPRLPRQDSLRRSAGWSSVALGHTEPHGRNRIPLPSPAAHISHKGGPLPLPSPKRCLPPPLLALLRHYRPARSSLPLLQLRLCARNLLRPRTCTLFRLRGNFSPLLSRFSFSFSSPPANSMAPRRDTSQASRGCWKGSMVTAGAIH